MTQKQEKPVLEFRYFSSWKKEQVFSLYEQVELKESHLPTLAEHICTNNVSSEMVLSEVTGEK